MLCEIQTVLGRAPSRLLKSWKLVLTLNQDHEIAKSFIKKVEDPIMEKEALKKKKTSNKQKLIQQTKKEEKSSIKITEDEISKPLKVSSRLATFTLVSVLKNQGLFDQALDVLDALEIKGQNLESISLERETIQTLIKNSQKD